MMEVAHGGRRERYYCEDDDEQESSKRPPFTPSSSSSSSPCWALQTPESANAVPSVEREHMFDKVVTPSDVGKLNRLVIPKQHAEKYFPLDLASGDKGLLLCFEEGASGKPWRFRYSYWNSSQSYVMTKGWSRFVKEKRLDAGDTVSFARGMGESGRGRLFIDWRRRPPEPHRSPLPPPHSMMPLRSVVVPWGVAPAVAMYGTGSNNIAGGGGGGVGGGQYLYYRSAVAPPHAQVQFGGRGNGTIGMPVVLDSVPVARGKAEAKQVRLFGVNIECTEPDQEGHGASSSFASQRLLQHKSSTSPLQWRFAPSPRSEVMPSVELDLHVKGKAEE